ncbi:unnamed protein product [Musa textilis]
MTNFHIALFQVFFSAHYSGEDLVPKFRNGEYWKKVFGPVFIYLNSTMDGTDRQLLWDDAKLQTLTQVESWPYEFPVSEDFQKCDERGSVTGRLLVRDKKTKENSYQAMTWQIKFRVDSVHQTGAYTLRVALASATLSELQVRFNDVMVNLPHFTIRLIGRDNSIARHGIHGLYWLFNIDVQSAWLIQGDNTIYLTQTKSSSPFQGIMYDYIRMEGPPG